MTFLPFHLGSAFWSFIEIYWASSSSGPLVMLIFFQKNAFRFWAAWSSGFEGWISRVAGGHWAGAQEGGAKGFLASGGGGGGRGIWVLDGPGGGGGREGGARLSVLGGTGGGGIAGTTDGAPRGDGAGIERPETGGGGGFEKYGAGGGGGGLEPMPELGG